MVHAKFQDHKTFEEVDLKKSNGTGSITSVGEERANLSAIVYL